MVLGTKFGVTSDARDRVWTYPWCSGQSLDRPVVLGTEFGVTRGARGRVWRDP